MRPLFGKRVRWAISLLLLLAPFTHGQQQLIILNWADYLDPELVQEFEAIHNAKVSEIYYSSDDNRTQLLLQNGAAGYDLILASGSDLRLYDKRQWLRPLEHSRIPNLVHIDPRWLTAFDGAQEFAVPYFWGTTGIVYRSDLLPKPISSWLDLYRPEAALQGKVAMLEDARDLIGMALKALGYSANSSDPQQLRQAEQLLLEQKPHVRTYEYLTLDEQSPLIRGDVVASMIYSGDALMLKAHQEKLTYIVPKEGGNIWVDYFVIGSKARNPELAYAFLNFINDPERAARLAEHVYYATPNRAAEALLPETFTSDPVIYPSRDALSHSEFYGPQPARALRQRNGITARVLH